MIHDLCFTSPVQRTRYCLYQLYFSILIFFQNSKLIERVIFDCQSLGKRIQSYEKSFVSAGEIGSQTPSTITRIATNYLNKHFSRIDRTAPGDRDVNSGYKTRFTAARLQCGDIKHAKYPTETEKSVYANALGRYIRPLFLRYASWTCYSRTIESEVIASETLYRDNDPFYPHTVCAIHRSKSGESSERIESFLED